MGAPPKITAKDGPRSDLRIPRRGKDVWMSVLFTAFCGRGDVFVGGGSDHFRLPRNMENAHEISNARGVRPYFSDYRETSENREPDLTFAPRRGAACPVVSPLPTRVPVSSAARRYLGWGGLTGRSGSQKSPGPGGDLGRPRVLPAVSPGESTGICGRLPHRPIQYDMKSRQRVCSGATRAPKWRLKSGLHMGKSRRHVGARIRPRSNRGTRAAESRPNKTHETLVVAT